MKNIILIFVFASVTLWSCSNDLLDKSPQTTLNPATFWQSERDVVSAVNGLYEHLPNWTWVNRARWTDIAVNSQPQGNIRIEGGMTSDEDEVRGIWNNYYKGVVATNYFLENVDLAEIDAALINRTKAEARFVRAFIYMRLVMDFGDVPMILKTLTIDEGAQVERSSAESIWDFINDELGEITDDLNVVYTSEDVGRITGGAALALRAKAMLYAGRYGQAFSAADELIKSDVYELHPDYSQLFDYASEGNSEEILSIQYGQSLRSYNIFQQYAPNSMSGSVSVNFCGTADLINEFQMTNGLDITDPASGWDEMDPYTNRDSRLASTIFIPYFSDATEVFELWNSGAKLMPQPGSGTLEDMSIGKGRNTTGFFINKYINQTDIAAPNNCGRNFIIMRYAEVLLIAAEALIESGGNLNEAKGYIDEVRIRAGMPILAADIDDQNELRNALRHERKVELAFEGWRYYDIVRWNIATDVVKGDTFGMSYWDGSQIVTVSANVIRNYSLKDYFLPIPNDERQLNPNLSQNEGYN